MSLSRQRVLSKTALQLALAVFVGGSASAFAQETVTNPLEEKPKSTSMRGSAAAASEMARQRKKAKQEEQAVATAANYPLATRAEPKLKASNKGSKMLNDIRTAYDAQKFSEAIAKAETLAAEASANAYDKSFAYQFAANAAIDMDEQAKGETYYKKALEHNGLDNNGHYQVMYNLAVTQYRMEKPADALVTLDRFLAETKSDMREAISLKAGLLGELDRAPEAAAMYETLLAAKPNDKTTLINTAAYHQQAGNQDRAIELLEKARKQGLLTEAKEYRSLYLTYINAEKYKEAVSIIDEGLAKGVIKPSDELANHYSVIAQNVYAQENTALAIDLYRRASQAASNGEPGMNLARVLSNEGRIAEAKQAARDALAKGLKNPKDADKILSKPGK